MKYYKIQGRDINKKKNGTIRRNIKKSRKETYKSEKSLQALANELTRLSNNDQIIARAIIQKSMANNWAGIFALKAEVKQDSRARLLS